MIRLECTRGSSNKYYELHLQEQHGRVCVMGHYGAIGRAPMEHPIYDGDSREAAIAEMQKKQLEKQKRGYIIVGNGNSPTPAEKKTGDLPVIWPMNAQGVKDPEHLEQLFNDPNYVCQEKLDGMRAVVHVTQCGLRLFSRSAGVNDPSRPLEKTSALPHLARLTLPDLLGTILDCEILLPGVDSAKLSGNVHAKQQNGQNHKVKLFVFDVLRYLDKDLMGKHYRDRLSILDSLKREITSEYVSVLPCFCSGQSKRALYNRVLGAGGEGIMFKRLDAYYIPGARPTGNWYKQKKSATFDCVVMGFTKGAGKYNSVVGAVRFGQYVNGALTELGQASGMSDQTRKQMSEFPKSFLGQVVTIRGMERLKSGAIRHPQFAGIRIDKRAKDCVWQEFEQ